MTIHPYRNYCSAEPICRPGCPSKTTPFYQVCTAAAESDRKELVQEYSTMRLVHKANDGRIKNALPLDRLHNELHLASLSLHNSGASNILIAKVSFDCMITERLGSTRRDYLFFDLRIPGTKTQSESVFSYELIRNAYGSSERLYAALAHFYRLGRASVNQPGHKHGHTPDYDHKVSKHDQYIRHTEQLLVAYLALPEAAVMLRNRLKIELRGKHPDASVCKVYHIGLHMHSTKTCCAPCEYSLIGLMNARKPFVQNKKNLGLLYNFQKAISAINETLRLTLPTHSPLG
jgi:hypothetical protein